MTGYDAPASPDDDRLGRWSFAKQIYELIQGTPRDWSVRIGVHGDWGEGKSTVLDFIDRLAGEEYVVIRFAPWSARTRDELWILFLAQLFDGFKRAGISLGREWGGGKLTGLIGHLGPTMKLLGRLPQASKSVELVAVGVQHLLQRDGKPIKTLREKLGQRRVIILIDDLDRAEPSILPDIFLALRDMLDIPGFAYVLAFEERIVSAAITGYREAIGDGKEFLEKLLDFTFNLPTVTETQKLELARTELQRSCSFADTNALDRVGTLLPSNPRKIKRLIRHVATLKVQASRHDPDELNWSILYLIQILRLESEKFLWRFLQDREDQGVDWFSVLSDEDQRRQSVEARINTLLDECKIESEARRTRLKKIALWLHTTTVLTEAHQIRYSAEMWAKPHAITWKEFRELFSEWRSDPQGFDLNAWVVGHATKIGHNRHKVADELFDTAHRHRVTCIEGAASARSSVRQAETARLAGDALDLTVGLYLRGLESVGGDYFRTSVCFAPIFGTSVGWAHFTAQEADQVLRNKEAEAIRRCAEAGIQDPLGAIAKLRPWAGNSLRPAEFQRLGEFCFPIFEDAVARDFLKRFATIDGLTVIVDEEEAHAEQYVTMRPDGALWRDPLKAELLEVMCRAADDSVVHENCFRLFHKIADEFAQISDRGQSFATQNRDILERLWAAATDRTLQYRVRKEFLHARQIVIGAGVPEQNLPIPDWLTVPDD